LAYRYFIGKEVVMKRLILIFLMVFFCVCCSSVPKEDLGDTGQTGAVQQAPQPKAEAQNPAEVEIYRSGVPQVENTDGYHLVQRTCTSTPIFSIYGNYVRTDVRCR
jgi:PBP1b-binding outer membrane lipoprotein LpoB